MVFKHDESKNEYWRKFIIVAVMRDCKKPETVILKAEGDIKWATEGYSSSLSLAGKPRRAPECLSYEDLHGR